jgi:hypothetical protein
MGKILEIYKCQECKHDFVHPDYYKCELTGRYIENRNKIPNWCPLKDAE